MSNEKFGLTQDVRQKISKIFDTHHHIDDVIIYSSRAKGNYRPGSDIDLSLKGDDLTLHELNQIVQELDELDLPYQFDVSIYQQINNPNLIDHISRVGTRFE